MPPIRGRDWLRSSDVAAAPWSRRRFLEIAGLGLPAAYLAAACSSPSGARNREFEREVIPYGPDPLQSAELTVPLVANPRPVAVLIHGGYWRQGFTREAMTDLAGNLARIGYASWNLEYRRVGDSGGGWTGTVEDIASGIDALTDAADEKNLDLNRVVVIGHSAGAQLAAWSAARSRLPAGSPGAGGKVAMRGFVGLSGVYDLEKAATAPGDGNVAELRNAVTTYLGGRPDQVPDRYEHQSPIAHLPLGIPQLLLHGTGDDRVPYEQSRAYQAAALKAGDKTTLTELDDIDHFAVVQSSKGWWGSVLAWLTATIGDPLD